MMGRWFGTALLALGLTACAGPGGGRHLTCAQSCDRSYDTCADSAGASRSGASFFGVGAACQRDLTACLKNCEIAAAQAKPAAKDGAKAAPGTTPGPAPKPPGAT